MTAFNGFVYWFSPFSGKILGFDFKNEKFVALPFPPEIKYHFNI